VYNIIFTRDFLEGLRSRAFKRRLWFKALDSLERGIVNLVCRVVDRVESPVLGRVLLGIVVKLRDALKGGFARLAESLGVRRAWEMAGYAVSWGYGAAWAWRRDEGFARFLAVIEFNAPSGWGV